MNNSTFDDNVITVFVNFVGSTKDDVPYFILANQKKGLPSMMGWLFNEKDQEVSPELLSKAKSVKKGNLVVVTGFFGDKAEPKNGDESIVVNFRIKDIKVLQVQKKDSGVTVEDLMEAITSNTSMKALKAKIAELQASQETKTADVDHTPFN